MNTNMYTLFGGVHWSSVPLCLIFDSHWPLLFYEKIQAIDEFQHSDYFENFSKILLQYIEYIIRAEWLNIYSKHDLIIQRFSCDLNK